MANLAEEFQRSWLTSLIGIALFCLGLWLLTWNEGRAVHHDHSLDETYNNAITLNPFEKLNPENDGRVVHISANLVIEEPLTEIDYGISIQAIKLKRRVQMYQWVEERTPRDDDMNGGATTSIRDYYYVTEWRDKLVDSSGFYVRHGHENPREIPLPTVTYVAAMVKLGHLLIGDEIKQKFNEWIEVSSDERPESRDVKLHMGLYYHCDDIWNPEVGDIRVQFYYAGGSGELVTVIAQQVNGVLVPYETSRGYKMALLRYGNLNINQMISAEHYDAKMETWKLRGIGMFIMYASSVCLAKLIKIMLLHVPILNNVVTGEPTSFSNMILSFSVSLLVIATAWILYRPFLGTGLLFAAISPLFYCTFGVFNVTVIAQQVNGVLVPYETSRGYKMALLRYGNLNINQMISAEHYDAKMETWKLRGIGMFIMYASSACLAKLIKIMLLHVPILNNVVTGEPTSFSNMILSFSVSLLVIVTAWILYRPFLGTGLLFAAISPLFYCTFGVFNVAQNGHIN